MSRRACRALTVALVLLAACREPPLEVEGDVIGVDATGLTVVPDFTPALGAVSALRIEARPPSILASVHPGTRARLELRRDGGMLVAVGVERRGPAGRGGAGGHDHEARHGGVVAAAGGIRAEIVASPDGRVRVFLGDPHGMPLSIAGTTGTITVERGGATATLDLVPAGDALEGRGAPLGTEPVPVSLALARDGQAMGMRVLLDPSGARAGVSQMPGTGCIAAPRTGAGRSPRCAIVFPASFTAMGTSPRGERAIVSQSHGGASVWRLPEATIAMGLDPLPPVVVPQGAHEPEARVIAVAPDGGEVAVAAGNRIVIFGAGTGRFRRRLDTPAGAIVALAWTPDASRLLVASAGDGKARLLEAATGTIARTLEAPGALLAIAADGGGVWAAGASDGGAIAIWDLRAAAPPRIVNPSLQPLAALAFAQDRIVGAGSDGTLRLFDPATGDETARVRVGAPLIALAVSPDGRHVATADAERTLRVHDLPSGAVADAMTWHEARIGVIGWGAGPTIVSGDNDGVLAVWDLPADEAATSVR